MNLPLIHSLKSKGNRPECNVYLKFQLSWKQSQAYQAIKIHNVVCKGSGLRCGLVQITRDRLLWGSHMYRWETGFWAAQCAQPLSSWEVFCITVTLSISGHRFPQCFLFWNFARCRGFACWHPQTAGPRGTERYTVSLAEISYQHGWQSRLCSANVPSVPQVEEFRLPSGNFDICDIYVIICEICFWCPYPLKWNLKGGVVLKFHFKIPFLQSCFLNDQYSSSFHVIGKQMKIKYLRLASEELSTCQTEAAYRDGIPPKIAPPSSYIF